MGKKPESDVTKYSHYSDSHSCLGGSKGRQVPLLFSGTSFSLGSLVGTVTHFIGKAFPFWKCRRNQAQECVSSCV